ncbi:WD40 repeat-like protein [Microthyrium microscopicum]|uniref:WD40 repeat-like protein n=1 Tax=Microthyrium microscopicum TaxID=703497 RepID=A0A6A6UPA6_9PEZI|nr:WD40 repeat-like protein [Microthyrium microscopicum]
MAEVEDQQDAEYNREQKIINEEYKIWKKAAPLLYDSIHTNVLDWPSLTCQWFPDVKKDPESGQEEHRLLLGSMTSSQASDCIKIARWVKPTFKLDPKDFNAETGEAGGHGAAMSQYKFEVIQEINHTGDVNKARYMPSNPNLIASMGGTGTLHIFDRSKLDSKPKNDEVTPHIQLVGHEKEGFGLAWNDIKEGLLASGSEDETVRIWDVKSEYTSGSAHEMQATHVLTHHTSTVNDVDWQKHSENILATVSDDRTLAIVDVREPKNAAIKTTAHKSAANCVAWSPAHENLLLTGGSDCTVAMWDWRQIKEGQKIHSFENHAQSVIGVQWSVHDPTFFASASDDRRINIWNFLKMGEEQTPDEAEDGPPELIFKHGGFTQRICDLSWNPNLEWTIAATADDNQLQIFTPQRKLVTPQPFKAIAQMGDVEDS